MAIPELRCRSKLHGKIVNDHVVEIKCNSRFCGSRPGIVVLHRFDLRTGKSTTHSFKDPGKGR